jgi:hypothetical protein
LKEVIISVIKFLLEVGEMMPVIHLRRAGLGLKPGGQHSKTLSQKVKKERGKGEEVKMEKRGE